uniref:Uncharacterized protein n=1 Tax=Podoviridae sp. ct8Lf7 TaxID=2827723 RepID=A0A8S5S048_9CAUD|nr:MAG TPA: hypothetical protein [Podoviridae sp. ct8Lf7]
MQRMKMIVRLGQFTSLVRSILMRRSLTTQDIAQMEILVLRNRYYDSYIRYKPICLVSLFLTMRLFLVLLLLT